MASSRLRPTLFLLLSLVTALGVSPARVYGAAPSALPDLADPARTGQTSPKDAAVVIGVEDYFEITDVSYARRDAEAFDTFARYTLGIPDDRITLLRDARTLEMERALKDAGARVGPGGRVWVYFAGHGAMNPNSSQRLLLGRDASTNPNDFAHFAVALDDVRTWTTTGGGEAVLVVDACYNGGGRSGEGELTGGRRLAVPDYALTTASKTTEWAATAPKELAAPLSLVQHGAFTYFAVGALRGWADGEVGGKRDGSVTAEEANRYVVRALRTVQAAGQTPQLVTAEPGTLVLARGVRERGPDLAGMRDSGVAAAVPSPHAVVETDQPVTGQVAAAVGAGLSAPRTAPANTGTPSMNVTVTFADGTSQAGRVTAVERAIDDSGDQGWTNEASQVKLSIEANGTKEVASWADVKTIAVTPGPNFVDDTDCTYSSEFTPWIYQCTLRTIPAATLKDGFKGNVSTRQRWRFTFDDGRKLEFQILNYQVRERDIQTQTEENLAMYTKLQNRLRAEIKTKIVRSITIN